MIPIDRVADQKLYCSGKHKRHGVNVQVIADAAGRFVWASAALPGSTHDLTAARTHGIIDALTGVAVMTFADKGHHGTRTANARSPPSRPGRFWSSCAAAHAEQPRSCRRSSSCTTSKPTATQNENAQ